MTHPNPRDTIRRPGRALRLDNPSDLPVFDAGVFFPRKREGGRDGTTAHVSLSDTVDRMAAALRRISRGNLDDVTEEDLRREGFSLAQIAACFDEAADIARRTAVRRIRSGQEG